uniref:Glycosyltransferase n=1 Tax=Maclura pomifera TaxID=3496 RepID=A1YGR3_MACPO|nr:gylcosyltransferase UGT71A13 [Maclura pomifera]
MIGQTAELVFVPAPGMGHLVATVEIAKLLVARDSRLFISVLIIKFPFDPKNTSYAEKFLSSSANSTSTERIQFIDLPESQIDPDFNAFSLFLHSFFENQKPLVRDAVTKIVESKSGRPDSAPRLAGFVLDIFCTTMMDVADEFGVPSYMFYTSGAGSLSLMSHFQALTDKHKIDTTEFTDKPDTEFLIPGFVNSVPAKVLPGVLFDKVAVPLLLNHYRKMRKTKGILVNTFIELESNVIHSLCNSELPPIYPVGPILNLNPGGMDKRTTEIVTWLDNQPPSSVVFLCFGSMGSFGEDQVREIALALEKSGVRFLWSLRQPPENGKVPLPKDYADLNEVLPEGFLDRTTEIGQVIGWAPQVTVLAHPSIGGFVSHCGWNSTLESLWFGVPVATWPLYAEQQLNAFQLTRELGLAVEVKMDYRKGFNRGTGNDAEVVVLQAEEIVRAIRCVMEHDSDARNKVKEMSEKSRKGMLDGGPAYTSLGRFISNVMQNVP